MPTPELPKATYRYDPYRNFRFRVKWDELYVAGFSKVSGLVHRGGADASTPRRMPGQTDYTAIMLERGVTHHTDFEQWANKSWDDQDGTGIQVVSLEEFRRDIILELYNEAGQKVRAYNIYRCWPSEFVGLPEMDGNGNAVAIQMLRLETEGWERDMSIVESMEPSFTLLSCCRFRGHRDKVFYGIGEYRWDDGSSAGSSSLRR